MISVRIAIGLTAFAAILLFAADDAGLFERPKKVTREFTRKAWGATRPWIELAIASGLICLRLPLEAARRRARERRERLALNRPAGGWQNFKVRG